MIRERLGLVCNSLSASDYARFAFRFLLLKNDKYIPKFREELAKYFGVLSDRIFLFGAGRMALYAFLQSLQLKENDEVIIAGYTCVVVPNAAKYCKLHVTYVDIDIRTLNINTTELLKQISERTKVIIISHNFGISYEDIHLIRSQFPGIVIIEDAAHALGSEFEDDIKVGLKGDASFFSFEFSKPITTGMGGALLINNPVLLEQFVKRQQTIAQYNWFNRLRIFKTLSAHFMGAVSKSVFIKRVLFFALRKSRLLFSSSSGELQGMFPDQYPVKLHGSFAYAGYLQMKHIQGVESIKKTMAKQYRNALKGIDYIELYGNKSHVMVRFPILFKEEISISMISQMRDRIQQCGFEVGDWFNDVVHPKGSKRYGYTAGSCREGEYVSQHIINLPLSIHSKLSDTQLLNLRQAILTVKELS